MFLERVYDRAMVSRGCCPPGADTSSSAGTLSHGAAPRTCHCSSVRTAHGPARGAAELGEAFTGSRLGKMLTQNLHVLSPLCPALLLIPESIWVHRLSPQLCCPQVCFHLSHIFLQTLFHHIFILPISWQVLPPTSCLHSFHFLQISTFGFTNFQLFSLPMSSASLLSLAPPKKAIPKMRKSWKRPGAKIYLISCQPGPVYLFLWA